MKTFILILSVILFFSCNNNSEKTAETNDGFTTDTSQAYYPPVTNQGVSPYGHLDTASMEDPAVAAERARNRELIYIGIDSTYSAISQIEDVKNEISEESSVNLSAAERNLKSRAIMNLNMIENVLARRVDSALLVNLKMHAGELAKINTTLTNNIEHLHDLSVKLAKVSQIMDRLTGILGVCISKGLIKPATPVKGTAAAAKAGV